MPANRYRGLRDGEVYVSEYRIQARDGTQLWLRNHLGVVHEGGRIFLTGVLLDVTERRRARDGRRRMMQELDHRVKDSLATARAIASRSARADLTVEEFRDRFTSRMRNMGRLSDALSAVRWRGLPMDQVASLVLVPIAGSERFCTQGPRVELPAAVVQSLGLVLHELGLNALAHGALSTSSGEIELQWDRSGGRDDSALRIEWIERGVHSPGDQRSKGLGTFMLESVLPYELDARVRMVFADAGLRCTLVIPLGNSAAAA
jgi:two-component sensor histidine kinase